MSETVMGIWSSLVRLSGTGGRASAISAQPALLAAFMTQSLPTTKQRMSRIQEEGEESSDLLRVHVQKLPLLASVSPTSSPSHSLSLFSFSLSLSLLPTPSPSLLSSEESVDIPLLRQQQIRLGLLKAARVLFSQQENLRQIMSRPTGPEGEQYSLFQQLLSAATRPSPIKAMFGRDELEVHLKATYVMPL